MVMQVQVYTTDAHLVIVMEYASEHLERTLPKTGRLSEKEAKAYFRQLIDAVAYCHKQVHFPPCMLAE